MTVMKRIEELKQDGKKVTEAVKIVNKEGFTTKNGNPITAGYVYSKKHKKKTKKKRKYTKRKTESTHEDRVTATKLGLLKSISTSKFNNVEKMYLFSLVLKDG